MADEVFLKLAGIRKVRTPGGAAYFDLPIGAPITADAILKAKKKHALAKEGSAKSSGGSGGSTASSSGPSGSLGKTKAKQTPSGPVADKSAQQSGLAKAPAGTAAANKKLMQSTGAAVVQPKPKAKVQKSSLSGPKKFKIGTTEYDVPEGSLLFRSKSHEDRAFVVDDQGKGHVFNSQGEVIFPDVYMQALADKLSGDLTDTDYVPDVFEHDEKDTPSESVSKNLADMKPGQVLRDSELTPQFVKQDNGKWKHTELDIDLDDDQLQPMVDSGELQPTTTEQDDDLQDVSIPKEIDFGKFETSQEFQATLDQYEAGDQLVLDMGEEVDPEILTKGEDGTWSGPKGISLKPSNMYPFRNKLSGIAPEGQKGDQEKLTPESVEADDVPDFVPDPEDTKPLNAKSKPAAPEAVKPEAEVTTPEKTSDAEKTPSKAAEAPFVDPYPFFDPDEKQRWKSKEDYQQETGLSPEGLEELPRTEAEYLQDKPYDLSKEQWLAQAPQPAKAEETKVEPKPVKMKIGDLKPGVEVGGGTILEVGPDPKNKKKIAVKYKSSTNGAIKTGSWWKSNDILTYPKDAPNPEDSDFKGVPNAKSFDGDVNSLKKGEIVFAKNGDKLVAYEKVKDSWYQRDGDPWSPDQSLPVSMTSEEISNYLGNKKFVTDYDGLSAIQAKNVETKKKAYEKLASEGLSVSELDDAEVGAVISVDHNPNKSPAQFVKTSAGDWLDNKGGSAFTSGLPKGKKEFLEGEEADLFKSAVADVMGYNEPWGSAEALSPEDEIDNSIQQHIAEVVDLAPAEPQGIQYFLSDGSGNPTGVPEGWKKFDTFDMVNIPVGDHIIVSDQYSQDSLRFTRTKDGWKDSAGSTWSTEEVLYNFPALLNDYHTNDGLPLEDVTDEGITESKTIKAGTELTDSTMESIADLPGSVSLDVGGQKYVASDNGYVNSATGAPLTEKSLAGKTVKVDAINIPDDAEGYYAASQEYVSPGTPLTTEQDFYDLPVGAKIHMGNDSVPGIVFTKQQDGSFSFDKFETTVDDLLANFHDGIPATFVGMGEVSESPLEDWEAALLELPFGKLGHYNKGDIADAVKSLEAHSGFQISYGLKAVPNNPITKNQAKIAELAKQEFPDLKPKPAFIAYLKKYGGISEAKGKPVKSNSKKYMIGAEVPKKTGVQGWSGGVFSAEDIQDAINILEGFQGKNFKAELNKKGNPLGSLDPNPIVGFDKDKTVTKKKFVDYLKNSISDTDVVADIEDTGDQNVVDNLVTAVEAQNTPDYQIEKPEKSSAPVNPITDKQKFGQALYKSVASGDQPEANPDDFDNYPVHTKIKSDDYSIAPDAYLKKLTGGLWTNHAQVTFSDETVKNYVGNFKGNKYFVSEVPDLWGLDEKKFGNIEALPSKSLKPKNDESFDVDAGDPADDLVDEPNPDFNAESIQEGDIVTPSIQEYAKVGTRIANSGTSEPEAFYFEKNEDGSWHSHYGNVDYDNVLESFDGEFYVYELPSPPEVKEISTSDILWNKVSLFDVETAEPGFTMYDANGFTYQKLNNGEWHAENDKAGFTFSPTVMPDVMSVQPFFAEKPQKVSQSEINGLPEGTALKKMDNPDTHLVKHADSWYVHKDSGEKMYEIDNASVANLAGEGLYMYKNGTEELSAPEATADAKSKVVPGKYTTTGKVFMYVNADGSGVYVDKSGTPKKLTPAAVEKNYNSGMNKYLGKEKAPSLNESIMTKPTPSKAKTAEGIPDGEYYLGLASSNKATKIVVKDGTYSQYKPANSKLAGHYASLTWRENASDGASVGYNHYDYGTGKTTTYLFVKKDGKWPEEIDGLALKDIPSNKLYIVNSGYAEPTHPSKKTLETKFSQGQLLDQYGTSIVPEGYSGNVMFLGAPTNGAHLANAVKNTQDVLAEWNTKNLKDKGLVVEYSTTAKFLKDNGIDLTDYNSKSQMGTYIHKLAANLTDGLSTEIPDSNAKELFDFTALGYAKMPIEFAASTPDYGSPSEQINAYVKNVSKSFGDGKIIGLHLSTKTQKVNWISFFKNGDFKSMYDLEVLAASKKGIPHASGWKHPGFINNESTNHIKWDSAVEGEIPAGETIPGDWTTLHPNKWSVQELDNYLIKAQMQNPQYLSLQEKRQWVTYHKVNAYKAYTDQLSSLAALRAKNGETPLSPQPEWTEGLVPANSWDYLFDGTDYPAAQAWMGDNQASKDWFNANLKNESVLDYWKNGGAKEVGYGGYEEYAPENYLSSYEIKQFVGKYFEHKEYLYQEELKKPVYKLFKKTTGGQNTTWIINDQFDRKAIFKPIAHSKGTEALFRVEVEHSGNELGRAAGFLVPESSIGKVGEDTGQIQKFIENKGDFSGVDLTTLTDTQLAQVAGHQVLDHFLQNDDTHHRNLLFDANGNVVGIDKGRAFLAYGTYEGLAHDPKNSHMSYNMLSSDDLVYAVMIDRMRSGDFTPEQAYQAYTGAMKAAKRINRMNDESVAQMVRDGVQNRPSNKWGYKDYHYFASQDVLDKVPNNADELVARVLEAKASMPEQVQAMYDAVFKAAGWDAPELPKELIPGHTSGWSEDGIGDKAFAAKVFGTAPLHASPSIQDGSSLVWTEQDSSGGLVVKGHFKVGTFLGKEVKAKLESVPGNSGMLESDPGAENFPVLSGWTQTLKDANNNLYNNVGIHDANKKWDDATWANFENLKNTLDADFEFYTPELLNTDEDVTFPSGNKVPSAYLPQYLTALETYKIYTIRVENDKKQGTYASGIVYKNFKAEPLAKGLTSYYNMKTGEQYKQLSNNGSYIYTNPQDGFKTSIVPSVPTDALSGSGGWTKKGESPAQPQVIVKKVSAHLDAGTLTQDGVFKQSGGKQNITGNQYDITLPTGEVIYFQDNGAYLSQANKFRFRLTSGDTQASLARVEEYLSSLGVDMSGSDDPETLYWRSMFHTVYARKGGGTAVESARTALRDKALEGAKKLGYSTYDLDLHNIGEVIGRAFPDQEQKFYRDLADATWGKDKVAQWIAEEKHMPQYQHMNLNDGDVGTGHAYWNRIDADLDKLYAKNTLLAVQANGADNAILKYITSGGMLSTEERLRMVPHSGASMGSDQGSGGANYVYTRVAKGSNEFSSMGNLSKGDNNHVIFLSPAVTAMTDTYGYKEDNYGNITAMTDSYYEPEKLLGMGGDTNEVMIKNTLSILDFIELMVFKDAAKRNEAIQRLKELGWEKIRGLPVEDRLVMRSNLQSALQKVKESWK